MPHPSLKTALVTRGHTVALKDGRVRPRSAELVFEEVPQIIQAFRRMVRGLEFDVSEMAITTYLCARAHGKRFTAIPVFPMRQFHHGAVLVPQDSALGSPRDLEGRRVGVNRGYTVTTGVWARAILQHEHGVDLRRVTWVLSGDEHVAEYRPPSNVVPIEPGRTIEGMLLAGELAAAIGLPPESPGLRPLLPDPAAAARAALRARRYYPINHTVVVRDDLLDAHPTLARDLFDAFVEAKQYYEPAQYDATHRAAAEVLGDPLPYGIDANREMLEAVVGYALEQGILSRRPRLDELFAV